MKPIRGHSDRRLAPDSLHQSGAKTAGAKAAANEPAAATTKPDLELKLSWMWPTYDNGTLGPDSVGLTLVNNLDHPVRWASAKH